MKLKIICIGKIKDNRIKQGISDYLERLKHYCKLEVIEIKDSDIETEGKKIIEKLNNEYVVALSEEGKHYTSIEFANFIKKANKDIVFIIGSAFGLTKEVKKQADTILSLSDMTFTHEMVRLFLTEQIYRAHTIIKEEKYHK